MASVQSIPCAYLYVPSLTVANGHRWPGTSGPLRVDNIMAALCAGKSAMLSSQISHRTEGTTVLGGLATRKQQSNLCMTT